MLTVCQPPTTNMNVEIPRFCLRASSKNCWMIFVQASSDVLKAVAPQLIELHQRPFEEYRLNMTRQTHTPLLKL